MARGAHFDHITSKIALFRAFGKRSKFLRRRDATAERGQTRAKNIRNEDKVLVLVLADRTGFGGGLTHLTSSADQFGVRVTHLMLGQTTLLVFRNEVLAREAVIDLAAFAARGTAEGS